MKTKMKKAGVVLVVALLIVAGVMLLRQHQAKQVDFDRPVPLDTLEKDAREACKELDKRQVVFDRRFPTSESKSDNDAVLNSQEWEELQDWTEGCEQARRQVEER